MINIKEWNDWEKDFGTKIKELFRKDAEQQIKYLREFVNQGKKRNQFRIMLVAHFVNKQYREKAVIIMFAAEGMPQEKKQEAFMVLGSKLYEEFEREKRSQGFYLLHSAFLVSEVWGAHYLDLDSESLPPSEMENRKEYFLVFGQTIFKDKFICRMELKRYADHILVGNEVCREFLWHDEENAAGNRLGSYPIEALFRGYAMAAFK